MSYVPFIVMTSLLPTHSFVLINNAALAKNGREIAACSVSFSLRIFRWEVTWLYVVDILCCILSSVSEECYVLLDDVSGN